MSAPESFHEGTRIDEFFIELKKLTPTKYLEKLEINLVMLIAEVTNNLNTQRSHLKLEGGGNKQGFFGKYRKPTKREQDISELEAGLQFLERQLEVIRYTLASKMEAITEEELK